MRRLVAALIARQVRWYRMPRTYGRKVLVRFELSMALWLIFSAWLLGIMERTTLIWTKAPPGGP